MEHLSFFKLQAKNLLKDFKSLHCDEGDRHSEYTPKYFDVDGILLYFNYRFDEDNFTFTLMNAQHIIAKMVGYEKWENLIRASESAQELAELLLRRFKTAEDIQNWEDTVSFASKDVVQKYGQEVLSAETMLDYARQYYELGDRQEIVHLPTERISVLTGKLRTNALAQFDDEHNPAGSLRLDSVVFCRHCKKPFDFKRSKVIKDNESNLTMVVCKNYPNCKGTYLDYKVLTPTVLYGEARTAELEQGTRIFSNIKMDSKVHCIHCGQQYSYNEANAVIDAEDGQVYVHCKNYPKCDGTLIDMMPVTEQNDNNYND